MDRTRAWRTATAGLATAGLLALAAGPAVAQLPELPGDAEPVDSEVAGAIPATGMGGFAGYAGAEGATVFVGLPGVLAENLAPVLDGLGVAGSIETDAGTLQGIRVDLAQVQADLERAAAGEDIAASATALLTNAILGSGAADQPGACTGGPVDVALPPDAATPLLTVTILGVDCEESDERAYAQVQVAGLDLRLGALLELGLPEEVAGGVAQLIDQLNESLLTPVSDGLCQALDPLLGVLLPPADGCVDQQPLLQLRDPFDLDVPVIDLDAVGGTAEVVQDGTAVTATATSLFTGLNVLGVTCVGGDAPPLAFTSTASSDGTTATRDASAPSLAVGLCQSEQALLRILLGDGPLGDVAVFEQIVQDRLFDGQLQQVFDGVDDLLGQLTTEAITQGSAVLGEVDGAGTTARTEPFVVASTIPLSGLPGLGDTPLGEVAVIVVGGATEVGVNAVPAAAAATPTPVATTTDPTPEQRLPRTGAGTGAMFGIVALGTAALLRRREG
jgi:hypothetical protein